MDINIANSIWYRLGFDVKEDFIERNKTYYQSEVRGLDFSDPASVDTINRWIGDATKRKISKMLSGISPDVVMYLINAIYFKGDWTHRFSEDYTRDEDFTLESGDVKTVPMMHINEEYRYSRGNSFGLLRLPYGREKVAMYILLPDEGESLDRIIEELNGERWKELTVGMEDGLAELALPKYRIEYGVKLLNGALSRLGMEIAFGPRADFSGISPGIFISEVIHKAVIEVNEKGSEAAAATVAEMMKSSLPRRIEFTVDRPFFFVIADDRTGSVLFMGKVADPR